MTAIMKLLPDWPALMTRETAEAYVDGGNVLGLLEEKFGLRAACTGPKCLRFARSDIDASIVRMRLERGTG